MRGSSHKRDAQGGRLPTLPHFPIYPPAPAASVGMAEAGQSWNVLMIRTTLSFGLLLGGLLVFSKWLHESAAPSAIPASPSVPVQVEAEPGPLVPESARPLVPHAAPAAQAPGQAAAIPAHMEAAADSQVRLVQYVDEPLDDVLNQLRPAASHGARVEGVTDEPDDEGFREGPTSPSAPGPVLTPELEALKIQLRQCLAYYYFRPENVAVRSPWGAMHAMLAYGVDTKLIVGDQQVNAVGYLCYNGVCNGQQLFSVSPEGRLQAHIGPGVQGHAGQFLAMLAQSRVRPDYPIRVGNRMFTVADLIEHEKETCRPASELTFKLIALVHYLPSEARWRSNDGQWWDIPRLIKEELAQPIVGAACGGTHRMTGFSYAVRKREARGEPLEGQWLRAKKFVDDFHEYAFKLQNPDGSFSTDWFAGRADFGPISRRLETTGHITEWLAFSLSPQQLVEPRMIHSVAYLTRLLWENRQEKWGIGPLGHGLHALAIYDERVFGGQPGQRAEELAEVLRAARGMTR